MSTRHRHPGSQPVTLSGRLNELYFRWGHNSFLFTLACIAWIAWRVGTNPARIAYPCQRVALAHVALQAGFLAVPLLAVARNLVRYSRNGHLLRVAVALLVLAALLAGLKSWEWHRENHLRAMGSGTIAMPPAAGWLSAGHPEQVLLTNGFPLAPDGLEAVVSVSYDPAIDYGGAAPYDPEVNPAYGFVWDTVEKLGLGNETSPLDSLVDPGDTVLIKPNWVDYGPAVYTRPEVVRPLIDMAIAAGATTVLVGDGGVGVPGTNQVMDSAGYSAMAGELQARHAGIVVATTNINVLSEGWHWVYLGGNSSFAGSGYTHYDLSPDGSSTLYGHDYYETADPQGVNPGGNTTGWYAVNDVVLDADVIINVPKMKTHQLMMSTLAIKNLVGCTLSSTYDEESDDSMPRIAHRKTGGEVDDNLFNNDIFWRSILDMNKIILYADGDGSLQPSQQRHYLNVIDGIQAMEKSQHHQYGGGGVPYDRHVVLASVDPVAADAVGCRLMGYDSSEMPVTRNAASDSVHPVGTNDPERIAIVGEDVDSRFNHVFEFGPQWAADAGSLAITDFEPPTVGSTVNDGGNITANVSGAVTAHVVYLAEGDLHIQMMSRDGDTYTTELPDPACPFRIMAHDEHFNTAQTSRSCDANADGAVDVIDWIRVKRIILGLDPWEHLGADADGSGSVDVSDWEEVKMRILGLSP